VLRARRRDEHHRHIGSGPGHGVRDRAEYRYLAAAELDDLARLARVGPADHLRTGREHPGPVPAALGSGDALDDDPAVLGQEDRHFMLPSRPLRPARRPAASSMVPTCSTTLMPASSRMRLPSAALLPSSRTTIGWAT